MFTRKVRAQEISSAKTRRLRHECHGLFDIASCVEEIRGVRSSVTGVLGQTDVVPVRNYRVCFRQKKQHSENGGQDIFSFNLTHNLVNQ